MPLLDTSELIAQAFLEDRPQGDLTTTSLNAKPIFGLCHLIAKQDLVLSGCELFTAALKHCDPNSRVIWNFDPGQSIYKGQEVAQIEGNLVELIQGERVALNFLGFLSGIATLTRQFVKACEGYETQILDTRKTLPLYRHWSKQAVRHGGGHNHRLHLSEAILVKENHLAIAGGIEAAITQIRKTHEKVPIELEVKGLEEVKQAVELKVNRLMLDNMSLEDMKEALSLIPKSIETEASGNMTLDRVPQVAALGVDFISVGALTHSAPTADLSLLFDWDQ